MVQIHSPRPLLSRTHIDLHRNCLLLFHGKNLSRLVNQWMLFLGGKSETKSYLRSALSPPLLVSLIPASVLGYDSIL